MEGRGAAVSRFTTFDVWHERGRNTPDVIKVLAAITTRGESLDDETFGTSGFENQCAAFKGRHAMGGQQFCTAGMLLDTRALHHVRDFDAERGVIDVEGGIQWPELIDYLARVQAGRESQWGIYQKQTGADRLSLGAALACNAHGRGLTLGPIIQQVESFDLLDCRGDSRSGRCCDIQYILNRCSSGTRERQRPTRRNTASRSTTR